MRTTCKKLLGFEKKKFEDAQRSGVVMRRIEYVHLLENRNPFKKIEINQEDKFI